MTGTIFVKISLEALSIIAAFEGANPWDNNLIVDLLALEIIGLDSGFECVYKFFASGDYPHFIYVNFNNGVIVSHHFLHYSLHFIDLSELSHQQQFTLFFLLLLSL
jgi:hypothetical protein